MEGEFVIKTIVDRILKVSETDIQESLFKTIVKTISNYDPKNLPKVVADDIENSLSSILSLKDLNNIALTKSIVEYAELIAKLKRPILYSVIPFLYSLTETTDEDLLVSVFCAFSNLYESILLLAVSVIHTIKPELVSMMECAKKIKNKLLSHYTSGNTVSLACLHFIHLCCLYFTKCDDKLIYGGIVSQFSLNHIPSMSKLFVCEDLEKEGYNCISMLVQAMTTRSSIFGFRHKVMAINSLFSVMSHRKDFIPILLPVMLHYQPTNESIKQIFIGNMTRLLRLPTFENSSCVLKEYIESRGIRADTIERAKDHRYRVGDVLSKKSVILDPMPLNPPFNDTFMQSDTLFDQEIGRVMKELPRDSLKPLSKPLMSLSQVPLSRLKQLPISVLATLVIMNLNNTPIMSPNPVTEVPSSVTKRNGAVLIDDDGKRARRETVLCSCEFLDRTACRSLLEMSTNILLTAYSRHDFDNDVDILMLDSMISLISLTDSDIVFSMIRSAFTDTVDTAIHVAEITKEKHPFEILLDVIVEKLPVDETLCCCLLKRIYVRDKYYRYNAMKLNANNISDFYTLIYSTLLLHIINFLYSRIDHDKTVDISVIADSITAIIVQSPRVPSEVFAYLVCALSSHGRQRELNDCSIRILYNLIIKRPAMCYDVGIATYLSFAKYYAKIPVENNLFMTQLTQLSLNEPILSLIGDFLADVTSSSPVTLALQRLSSFTGGVIILPTSNSDYIDGDKTRESGVFKMVQEDVRGKALLAEHQKRMLQGLETSVKDIDFLCGMYHYHHSQIDGTSDEERSSIETLFQNILTVHVLPHLVTIADCVHPVDMDVIAQHDVDTSSGRFAVEYNRDGAAYGSVMAMLDILEQFAESDKESVLMVLRRCLILSGITKDEDISTSVLSMFSKTRDVQFRILLYNWFTIEEDREIIRMIPSLPSSIAYMTLQTIAMDPSPLTHAEILCEICSLPINKSVLACVKYCVESIRLFTSDIFTEVVEILAKVEQSDVILMYLVLMLIKAKPDMIRSICSILVDFTKLGGWKNASPVMWKSFTQFVKLTKATSSEILYNLSEQDLAKIFSAVPDCKVWLLDYMDKENKEMPDYMATLLQN